MLILEGILQPFPDNTLRPRNHPSRGLVLRSLYRMLDYYGALGRVQATYRGSDGDRVLLEVKRDVSGLALAPEVALFRSFRDVSYPSRSIPLTLGDRVVYHETSDRRIEFFKVIAYQSVVLDGRYSTTFSWA